MSKGIQAFPQTMLFFFFCFLIAPTRLGGLNFLPLAVGNDLISTVMVDGARLWELPLNDILTATAVGAAYLAIGIVIFSCCENVAKSRGLLGHY